MKKIFLVSILVLVGIVSISGCIHSENVTEDINTISGNNTSIDNMGSGSPNSSSSFSGSGSSSVKSTTLTDYGSSSYTN
ncbi:MAG: hypothetical protein ACC609_11390 [Methanobacterium formicicum]